MNLHRLAKLMTKDRRAITVKAEVRGQVVILYDWTLTRTRESLQLEANHRADQLAPPERSKPKRRPVSETVEQAVARYKAKVEAVPVQSPERRA